MAKSHALSPQEAVERGREYVQAYIERVRAKDMPPAEAPALYRDQPHDVHCHALENGGLLLFIRNDPKGGFSHVSRAEMASHSYDFSVHLSKAQSRPGEAKARGAADADRDCSLTRAIAGLEKAREDAAAMLESTEGLLKTNPWLDEYASASIGASERLTRELEGHADALRRELESLASSHRAAMTDLATGEAPAEAAPARDDAALAQLKSRLAELEEAHDEKWKMASKDFDVLSQVAARVDTFGDDLEALNLKFSRELDESGGSRKAKENLKVLTGMIEALESEVGTLRDEVKVSKEIKDTLFRDSKRLHNMHERLNAMETQRTENADGRVAELRKRLDTMERRMTSEISIAVAEAFNASIAVQPAPKTPEKRKR